jgi:serine/threonine-protein kinase
MDQSQWELINSLVDQALTFSGPERDSYVLTICSKYPSISTEIIELLECIEESEQEGFLNELWSDQENLLFDVTADLVDSNRDETFLNREIGPYRISEIIARGGMGTVFKASRIDGEFHRDVAIKIIKSGINAGNSSHRFQVEKEILAGLQHPNIACMYGGGITEEGLPYLVMEYIDGVPIDEYCDKNRLTLHERLDLFKDVCSAVHFAHKNLIVHRDLKPQNIYVTGDGIVKILDFGIAKLMNSDHSHISILETIPGQKLWTPQYASPEQVASEPITIQTDIYSMGILLCRVLTGTYPYDLDGKTLTEIEDTIKNASPLLPSRALSNIPDPVKTAYNRKTAIPALKRSLQGDLDALISKAIRKEAEYRYHTVAQLSEDIGRYQSGNPLIARTGTLKYKTGKFIRRNNRSLAATTAFLIILIFFSGYYTLRITDERNTIEQERDKLNKVVKIMTGLLESGNPTKNPAEGVNTRFFLEKGVEEAELLEGQPSVQTQMLNVVGDVYMALGEYERAEELYSKAVKIQKDVFGPETPGLAESMNKLAVAFTRQGNFKLASDLHRKALNIQIRHFGDEHPKIAETLSLFGSWIPVTDIHEAARLRERSLEIRRAVYGKQHPEVAFGYMDTGRIKRGLALPGEAIKDFRKALKIRKSELGPDHPDVAESMIFLGDIYRLYDIDTDSAEILYRDALHILEDKYRFYHPSLLHVLGSYANLLSENGNHDGAMNLLQRSVEVRRTVFGANHNSAIDGSTQLANELYRQGKYMKAEELYRTGLSQKIDLLGENHLSLVGILRDLGKTLVALKKFDEAESYLNRALQIQRHKFEDKTVALTIGQLADLEHQQGNLNKARELYQRALSIYKNENASNHFDALKLQNELENVQVAMLQDQ